MKSLAIVLGWVLLLATACVAPSTAVTEPTNRAAAAPAHSVNGNRPSAPPDPATVQFTTVADGFTQPLALADPGDGSGRLFVAEHGGKIWIINAGQRVATPFLDISQRISTGSLEYGILGFTFDPDYAQNGRFYLNFTVDRTGNTVVARYTVSATTPDAADPNSELILLTLEQTTPNHRGGHLAFGPDGYLYLSLGDGGPQGDPQKKAQNLHDLHGKILRIDVSQEPYAIPADNPFVNTPDAKPEIWAYGLRNPWRFSFDRATGDLYIGDVGQNQWEEIDFQAAGVSGGQNYGWNAYEGTHPYTGGAAASADMIPPVSEYDHSDGVSVTGGYVYRGSRLPALNGVYFYADFASGTIWSLYQAADGSWQNNVFTEKSGYAISAFGEDSQGELYLLDYSGSLLRFDPVQ